MTYLLKSLKIVISILLLTATFQLYADTILVGGIMEESETWTNENTYIVYEDLVVPEGITLTILQGVEVRINYARGITIDNGELQVLGNQTDSVYFVPNYSSPGQTWKWKGIVAIVNISTSNMYVNYAQVSGAETAIKLENSQNVRIENSSLVNCQNLGFQILNSSSCILNHCAVKNNYDGIEIFGDYLGVSSNNIISNCVIENQNHNVYIYRNLGGICQNNLIKRNIIQSGNSGLWIYNMGLATNSQNVIEQNIFCNNGGEVGYGLYLDHDSTVVRSNIFYRNSIAVFCDRKADNCMITNNSFYKNKSAVVVGTDSKGNKYSNNTFSQNTQELFSFKEINDVELKSNNMLHNYGHRNIVVNNSNTDLSVIENFWGTTDTAQIHNFIYDSLDNPTLGKLTFIPFLENMDTSNPISPPYDIIKQMVNDRVLISWHANKEQDLMGYRVYFGDYANYSFSESVEVGTDSSFILPRGITIGDSIAATAYDSTINQQNNQLQGNESPFAFANIYPYAGNDTIICMKMPVLKIENSTIPFNYQGLFWQTGGDGAFSNLYSPSPNYFPGDLDIQAGGVTLFLNVVNNAGDTLIDSFNLSILSEPIVFAGNDTTVLADTEILLVEAAAQNFDSIVWITHGDGTFNNNALINPVYSPGILDTESGVALLEMTAFSRCGDVTDSIVVFIEPYYSVEGNLWISEKKVNQGVVVAFKESNDGARAVQIESTEADGSFKFEKLTMGNYYLYALPDTNNSDHAAPGYYANDLRWQKAYLLPVTADVYDVDIQLQLTDFILPHGEASISGHMVKPDDSKYNSEIYCSPWFENSTHDFCREGLSNITVLLFNNTTTKLLDYTLTDEFGHFYFNQLPFGQYIVDAEKAGIFSYPSPLITLSPEHKNEPGVMLEINQQKIAISLERTPVSALVTTVFPNPASAEINIPYSNPLMLSSKLELYDLRGNFVLNYHIPIEKTSTTFKLDVIKLPSGLYFGQIINSNQTIHFRFVKR